MLFHRYEGDIDLEREAAIASYYSRHWFKDKPPQCKVVGTNHGQLLNRSGSLYQQTEINASGILKFLDV